MGILIKEKANVVFGTGDISITSGLIDGKGMLVLKNQEDKRIIGSGGN